MILLIAALLATQAQPVSLKDFDLSLAYGAKALQPWRPPVAPDGMRPELKQFARTLLDKALEESRKETDPYWKARDAASIADGYLYFDSGLSKKLLEGAWTTAEIKDGPNEREDLAKVWCAIDPKHAKDLFLSLKEEFFEEEYLDAVATYNPTLGCQLLSEVSDEMDRDRDVTNLAYDLMDDDPSHAVAIIRGVKNIDQERTIGAVIYSLASESIAQAEPLLQQITTPLKRDQALEEMVSACATNDPGRSAATALIIKEPEERAEACSHMVRAYARSSPAKAKFMAEQALAAWKQVTGDEAKDGLYRLLPDIAYADTPGVRDFLTGLEQDAIARDTESGDRGTGFGTLPSLVWPLIGAWEHIDPQKAEELLQKEQKIKPHGDTNVTDIGTWLNAGYEEYLVAAGERDPQQVAATLKPMMPENSEEPSEASMRGRLGASHIAHELFEYDPEVASVFAKALGDKDTSDLVANLGRAKSISLNPMKAFQLLPLMERYNNYDPPRTPRIENQSSVAMEATRALYDKGDIASAEKIATLVSQPEFKSDVFQVLAWREIRKGNRAAVDYLHRAAQAAMQEPRAGLRSSDLVDVANQALQMADCYPWKTPN